MSTLKAVAAGEKVLTGSGSLLGVTESGAVPVTRKKLNVETSKRRSGSAISSLKKKGKDGKKDGGESSMDDSLEFRPAG